MKRSIRMCSAPVGRLLIRLIVPALTILGLLALPQDPAFASGGPTIASAPTVVYGQQQFGNTVTDQGSSPNCDTTRGPGRSWWALPVIAGDRIKVDLEGQTEGDGFLLEVYPIGTNDFNVTPSRVYTSTVENQKDKEELVFLAPASGIMPMDIASCDSIGTYDFTATDQHALVVRLNPMAYVTLNTTLTAHAYLASGAPVPDGMAFWVNAYWSGHGFANYEAKTTGGNLWFSLALPRSTIGKTVTFQVARLPGAEYLEAKSNTIRSHVNPPKSTHSRPRHRHHRHHHHRR